MFLTVRKKWCHFLTLEKSVIAADQPIYATAKQSLIQCYWADNYGEDKFVILFGGLHIEITAFKSLGTLLADSGWTDQC